MRLSEEKIKQAILHPQLEIRQRAVRYFDDSYSEDEGVVPLVIQAVEKYGREDAYQLVGGSVNLRHTGETIAWVVEELQDPASERYENYVFNLNRVLCDADLALLLPRESEILETCRFHGGLKDYLIRRLELISWDEAACWQRLEQICEEGKDKRYTNEFDWDVALDLLEALKDDPMAALSLAFGRLRDNGVSDEPEERKTIPPASNLAPLDEILADSRTDARVNRVGRNDPCPCGSGRKYKKCCMRKQQN